MYKMGHVVIFSPKCNKKNKKEKSKKEKIFSNGTFCKKVPTISKEYFVIFSKKGTISKG